MAVAWPLVLWIATLARSAHTSDLRLNAAVKVTCHGILSLHNLWSAHPAEKENPPPVLLRFEKRTPSSIAVDKAEHNELQLITNSRDVTFSTLRLLPLTFILHRPY